MAGTLGSLWVPSVCTVCWITTSCAHASPSSGGHLHGRRSRIYCRRSGCQVFSEGSREPCARTKSNAHPTGTHKANPRNTRHWARTFRQAWRPVLGTHISSDTAAGTGHTNSVGHGAHLRCIKPERGKSTVVYKGIRLTHV